MTVKITDDERQLLVMLLLQAWVKIKYDPELCDAQEELKGLIAKLSGVDKTIIVEVE